MFDANVMHFLIMCKQEMRYQAQQCQGVVRHNDSKERGKKTRAIQGTDSLGPYQIPRDLHSRTSGKVQEESQRYSTLEARQIAVRFTV
jgi:hypothetical protein